MTKRVFIDTNIILDLFTEREPFFKPALKLFSLIENNEISGYVSALSFSDIFYILRKHVGKDNNLGINSIIRSTL